MLGAATVYMELFKHTDFDFLGKKWPFIILSLVITGGWFRRVWLSKGDRRYGIDFRGGALITVTFANRPPVDKVRAALFRGFSGGSAGKSPASRMTSSASTPPGRHCPAGRPGKRSWIASRAAFGQPGNGKYNINAGGAQGLADRLRDALAGQPAFQPRSNSSRPCEQHHGLPGKEQLSGLIRNLDDLRSVPGVTPRCLNVL